MKNWALLLLILIGCQQLKPESVSIPEYPDLKELMAEQVELLGNAKIRKEVALDGKREIKVLEMDSASWADELSFLKEINPNQPEYVGALEKSGDELNQTLTLGEGEKGSLKTISYAKNDESYDWIEATFHEDKDVYVHHREIKMQFEDGKLSSILIDGYQKMMFKDTVKFGIKLKVDSPLEP